MKFKKKKKLAPYKVLNTLRGKVWKQFSIYVRSKDADWKGEAQCFTCGKRQHWRLFDAGHFKHGVLDYDLENISIQCTGCNRFWHGRLDVYATRLVENYGPEILKRLDEKKKNYQPENTIELQKLLNHYTKLNKENGYT
jgi:hypothetical protein